MPLATDVYITPASKKIEFYQSSALKAQISGSNGDIYVSGAADVILDAAGLDVLLKTNGTLYGKFSDNNAYWDINGSAGTSYLRFISSNGGAGTTAYTHIGDGTHNQYIYVRSTSNINVNDTTIANSFFKQTDSAGNTDTFIQAGGDSYILNQFGLGTSNPSYILDVFGSARIQGDSHETLEVRGQSGYGGHIKFTRNAGSYAFKAGMIENNSRFDITDYQGTGYEALSITSDLKVGIGNTSPKTKLTVQGALTLKEQAAADADTSDYGQIWVKNTAPNTLYFTDDVGTDHDLTAGGGGTIGGSLSDNYIPIGSAANTVSNFVLGLTEDDSIYIGTDPSATTNSAGNNVALGISALDDITTADDNTAIGYKSLYTLNSGIDNVAVGTKSGYGVTTGGQNVLVGKQAGENVGTHSHNTYAGYNAAIYNSGDNNVGIGSNAMRTGSNDYNVAVGMSAMTKVSGGAGGVAVGFQSGYHPTGNYNTWVGYNAGFGAAGASAEQNVAVGREALMAVTTANKNVAIGYQALKADTTAHSNVAIGYQALDSTTAGSENVAVGAYAGQALVGTTSSVYGGFSVFVGHTAGFQITGNVSYGGNTMVGHAAGYSATGADRSTGIGGSALYYADGAKYNTAVGRVAGAYAKGTGSTHVGDSSGYRVSGNYNTSVGYAALSGSSSGTGFGTAQQNVAIGREAMLDATSAQENVVIGNYAAAEITGGDYNVAIGHAALRYGTTTNRQVAIGYAALSNFTQDGDLRNTAVGMYSMLYPRSGNNNIAMGYGAMQGANSTYDSDYNVALGSEALFAIAGADNNTAVGFQSLRSTTDATNNTAVGLQAMYSNTTGISNTAVGAQALYTNVDGDGQTAIGYKALISSEPATDGGGLNTAVGFEAGFGVTTGHSHVIVGYRGARSMTGGERNIYIGSEVGYAATDGSSNTVIGNQASYHISGASNVTSLGRNAGYFLSGNNNTFLGMGAARGVSTGGDSKDNVAIGATAGYYFSTANYNVAVGNGALAGPATGMTGDNNVAVGRESANSVTSGHSNVFMGAGAGFGATTAAKNVIIGMNAGYALGTHQGSTIIGFEAGRFMDAGSGGSVAIGHQALYSGTQNYQDTAIGINAGKKATGASANNVFIGSSAGPSSAGAISNKLYIHNAEGTPLIGGDFSAGTVTIDGDIYTNSLGQGLRFAGRDDLLIRGTSNFKLELTTPQDMCFAIDSDNNATTQAFRFKKDTKTPESAGTELMTILENGKVGIGTTSPSYKLDVRNAGHSVALISGAGNGTYPILHVKDSTDISTALFEGNRAGDQSSRIALWHNPASSHSNSHTALMFQMNDSGDNKTNYAQIVSGIDVITDGSEGGNLQFHVAKAGTLTEVARFQDEGRLGIGTTAPNVELHVNGDGRFEENHKLYFSDSATNVFIRGASSDLELHSGDDIYINATDDIRIASDQVTFADDADNVHLTIMETGTNSALLSGANSAGLYFATQSGTRLELTGNHIIKTGQTIDNMLPYNTAAVHSATTATQTYQIESQANPGQAGVTHTVTLNLPNGTVGGERFTVTCIAIGSFKPGTGNLTGEVVLGGIFINGTNLLSPTVTTITGATAAGQSVMQVKTFEFTWVASQFNPSGIGGWVYTVNTM